VISGTYVSLRRRHPPLMLIFFKSQQEHDVADLAGARDLADRRDVLPIGLFYRRESADRYDMISVEGLATSRNEKLAAIHAELGRYEI